ncbi:aminopeptidase P family protein [Rhodospirillaceae bacterium KN72]|uniref:Aminopeptidase P family protein n=1 Tax=Pacificispira spongiicola TaxID=2729598 RepID=A0A7Y0DZ51_9PROT|nr:Xaa-Pro peptidase family protein [Pacificispira spongiicola]NMM44263.1 aminopeptidase P family protein [Pacificispira spongiicola]
MGLNSIATVGRARQARQHGAMEYSDAPVDLDILRGYRLNRLRDALKAGDYAGGLFFNQLNTRYATDATNMQVWCAHYEARCVFVSTEGPVVLFDYSNHPHLAEDLPGVDEYRVIPAFYFFTAGTRGEERVQLFADQIADLVAKHGGGNRRIAVDHLSLMGAEALRDRQVSLHDGEGLAEVARSIKSPEELVLMKASMDVCEQGIREMREILEPGITENALWAKLHEVNIRLGGEWIETRLLSSGPRTNPWFRECSMRPIERGDMVSFDTDLIGPYGYCSDISRAWICGDKPNDEQRRLYSKAYEQIEHNIALLGPGRSFRDVTHEAWAIPEEFLSNRYSSCMHGVGLADEYPSIKHAADFDLKGYDGVFEPGMVVCVESFIGTAGGREGVKLEEQVVITETGIERQSTYPFEMDWL